LILLLLAAAGCITIQQLPNTPDVDLVEEPTPREELTTTILLPRPISVAAISGELKFIVMAAYGAVARIKPGAQPEADDGMPTGKPIETERERLELARMTTPLLTSNTTTIIHMRPCLQTMVLGLLTDLLDVPNGNQVLGFECSETFWSLRAYDFQPGQYRIAGDFTYCKPKPDIGIEYKLDLWLERERSDGVFERVATFVRIDDPIREIRRTRCAK
ncbi:MAG: hypothetical protein NT088_01095, partial [Candidatus Omnitrophica bacterium]|nr:hypothetical protein [Candidatus Omnitrophota bacterium]